MDAAFTLAENTVKVKYDELPSEIVDLAKKDILDALGVAIAGSATPAAEEVAGLIKELGGKREITAIAFDCMVPSPNAALVNGCLSHALDYDDTHPSVIHPACSIVPASFATAQRKGKVNGKEFITAVTLGIDVACRMGNATKKDVTESGWIYTANYGCFGAAAASGKILGLTKEKMVNAFGIAYSQAGGNFQCILDVALTKRMQPGFAAKAGVLSALLAERGITGAQNSMEGKFGIFNLYHRGDYDPLPLTSELGKRYELAYMLFKPYPSCRHTHGSIQATLELVLEHNIKPEDVEEINISTGEHARSQYDPLERKRRPQVIPDAQFNIPYTVSVAVVKRKVSIDDFTLEAIKDPRVLQIAQKVNPRVLPELTRREVEPVIVEIKTKDGNRYSKRLDYAKGDPRNPMTMEEIADKFRDCASHARKRFSKQVIERAIQLVSKLEEADDVGQIIRLFS